MIDLIGKFFGFFMYYCYRFLQDYGLSIILFTLITKIILLPISIMVQKNSIKMVQMYPELNRIKAKCFGNKDMISEEQYKLYKKNHYHPMLDLVPVIAQLVILMGVINVIYQPLTYLLQMGQEQIDACLAAFQGLTGISPEVSSVQIRLISWLHQGNREAFLAWVPDYTAVPLGQAEDMALLDHSLAEWMRSFNTPDQTDAMMALNLHFCGFDLGLVPWEAKGISLLVPVLAAASSWLMCFTQNRSNVLQSEQSKANQWTTLLISVGLSLYLGLFVPAGVGFYWIVSNLFSIAQMYLLNYFIDPKKYIDYDALEESRRELAQMQALSSGEKKERSKEEIAKEIADYKRFLAYPAKQIVFYSEKNGFYKYFKDVIEEILAHSDVVIHYITSDPKDEVFGLASEQFQVYYISETKLIVLMMKMDADVVVLTMPDLQKYHIKRSLVRDDIEYVYMDHAVASANLTLRKHALDHFDTIFATNEKMAQEIRMMEKVYNLPKKTIVKSGYSLIDNMIAAYQEAHGGEDAAGSFIAMQPEILIAPSWQEDNLMDSCIEEMLDALGGGQYHVTVRPHPQYVRHFEEKLNLLAKKYEDNPNIELQTDFSSNKTVFDADVLITDWSGIAYEYAFTTLKPVLFINTPMKVMNPDYKEIDVVPFDIEARDQVGISVDPDRLDTLADVVMRLLTEEVYSKDALKKVRENYLYNVGSSAEVGAKYLLHELVEAAKKDVAAEENEPVPKKANDAGNAQKKASKSKNAQVYSPAWMGQNLIASFRNRVLLSALFLALPVMMVWILGPLEIYAGNVGELFFGTGNFFWMFLAASVAAVAVGTLILSLLPDKVRYVLHTLIFAGSLCCYLQNMFMNQDLIKSDGSKVDWSLYSEHSFYTVMDWVFIFCAIVMITHLLPKFIGVILAVLGSVFSLLIGYYPLSESIAFHGWHPTKGWVITGIYWICVVIIIIASREGSIIRRRPAVTGIVSKDPEGDPEKIMAGITAFLILVQTVAVFSLLFTNPYSVKKEKMYALSGEQEFCVAPGKNIIVLILDRYGNITFENMMEEEPTTEQVVQDFNDYEDTRELHYAWYGRTGLILKDFTYYNNANSRYNYTFPSITHMLTLADPMCTSTTTDQYKEQAWTETGRSREFHDLLQEKGYTYHFYTGSGSAIYKDAAYLQGSIDNVEEQKDISYKINHGYMFYIMTKSSLLKYAPYPLKPYLEIQSFYYDGIVSFEGMDTCVSDNGEYYRILKEQGLTVDESMENALIITHLNGIHNPLTINENAESVPADTVTTMQVQKGLNVILEEYLQQLKDLGVYDDATIIITADHGQYLDTLDLQPIYLIKPAGQTQEYMHVNTAPISSEDFLPTVLTLIGDKGAFDQADIFDWKPGEYRERATSYFNNGEDKYRYTGDRGGLTDAVKQGIVEHYSTQYDWN
ncbi:MAG: membrane protein insertase YidC [Lachnospiraceae bacterium]|nr:membrane protein insertase YidC [Lachnospiraceae bacterium]